jgi:hypothetical protein
VIVLTGHVPDSITWTLGSPGECAIMGAGRLISLADLGESSQCRALAEQTAQLDYSGVVGPDQTAFWFAQRATELGITFLQPIPQCIHVLREKPKLPGAPGYARRTTSYDASRLADWITAFVREATPHEGCLRANDWRALPRKGGICSGS